MAQDELPELASLAHLVQRVVKLFEGKDLVHDGDDTLSVHEGQQPVKVLRAPHRGSEKFCSRNVESVPVDITLKRLSIHQLTDLVEEHGGEGHGSAGAHRGPVADDLGASVGHADARGNVSSSVNDDVEPLALGQLEQMRRPVVVLIVDPAGAPQFALGSLNLVI